VPASLLLSTMRYTSVEFVEIHCVDAVTEPLVFALKPSDRFLVLALLISTARMERLPHPFQHFVVEPTTARAGKRPLEPKGI
jgi:hypothetical protein